MKDIVNELKEAGHAAYLVDAAGSGSGARYGVRVGRYSSLDEAARSARVLEKSLGRRASVTAVAVQLAAAGKAASYGQ
jgi:hypothetical protein